MWTFRGGTSTLTGALADTLEGRIHRNATVRGVERVSGGYRFLAEGPEGGTSWTAERVIVAVPACRLSDLFAGFGSTAARRIAAVPHPPLAVLALGYRRSQIDHPLDGFGLLVPRTEPYDLTGVLFSSRLDPGRAPEDCALLTCYLGGARAPQLLEQDTSELVRRTRSDLRGLLGVEGEPQFVHHQRWDAAIPQYEPGHDRVVRAAARFERRHPGLQLAGNYRRGISVVDALDSGWRAAERVLSTTPQLAV
jgi:oxygen-dependent protoporphyrinogen oxidase